MGSAVTGLGNTALDALQGNSPTTVGQGAFDAWLAPLTFPSIAGKYLAGQMTSAANGFGPSGVSGQVFADAVAGAGNTAPPPDLMSFSF